MRRIPLLRFQNKQVSNTAKLIFLGLLVILVLCLFLLYLFGALHKETLIKFIEDMVPQTLGLILVVFFVDRLVYREKIFELKAINQTTSNTIYFLINRLAFWILNYLGVIKKTDTRKYLGEESNFKKAVEKFKEISPKELQRIYIQKLKKSDDKKLFIDGFYKILNGFSKSTKEIMQNIYPAPNRRLLGFFKHDLFTYCVMIKTVSFVYGITKDQKFIEKTSGISEKEKRKFNKGLDLLLIEVYPANKYLTALFEDIIDISELARNNEIFSVL